MVRHHQDQNPTDVIKELVLLVVSYSSGLIPDVLFPRPLSLSVQTVGIPLVE